MTNARKIIEAYFSKNHSDDLQKDFVLWLNDERDSREKDDILFEIWEGIREEVGPSTEISYRKLQTKIAGHRRLASIRSYATKWMRIAALFLLPLLSVALTYLYMQNTHPLMETEVQWVECIVPNGELRTVNLPDSSKVQLNAGSILIYPQHFGQTRNVYLNGEAYFSVAQDKKHPFIVKTTDLNVEVLGTVFDVSTFANDEQAVVTLESGIVNVQFRDNRHPAVTLLPNEQVRFHHASGTVEKQAVKVAPVIAWTQGNLIIQRMSIEEIAKIIERKYNLKIYVNSKKYPNERISMKLMHNESITEVMGILQHLVPNLGYKIENEHLYIY
ncbi:MAG: FecR domain-containing protein [Dysgonamonadaceae bacterium]|jgi:ferric-dicitrate binding protein FerR (iron transport regulator)|nr:FecR domain-containing protein [Dysgonamonadaceae bacterium]